MIIFVTFFYTMVIQSGNFLRFLNHAHLKTVPLKKIADTVVKHYCVYYPFKWSTLYTNSLVNVDLIYAIYDKTTFQKVPIPNSTST